MEMNEWGGMPGEFDSHSHSYPFKIRLCAPCYEKVVQNPTDRYNLVAVDDFPVCGLCIKDERELYRIGTQSLILLGLPIEIVEAAEVDDITRNDAYEKFQVYPNQYAEKDRGYYIVGYFFFNGETLLHNKGQ